MRICKVDGCGNKYAAKGYCHKHYKKLIRYGTPLYKILRDQERHGMCNSSEYRTWSHMLSRCYNKKVSSYKRYGGRGITVCNRWRNSFLEFYVDMGLKPFSKAQIDRIDNDGNYEPDNCCWTICAKNVRHRSTTKLTMEIAEEIRKLYIVGQIATINIAVKYNISLRHVFRIVSDKSWRKL